MALTDVIPELEIFTDGACLGNPGPGGWGALLRGPSGEQVLSGGAAHTTNNRMELMAAIAALEALTQPTQATVTTDSTYVRDGVTRWIQRWKVNGWRTSTRTPVKNEDLWRRLDAALARHRVRWLWVRGHTGHPENTRVDALAAAAARAAAATPNDR